ncbi:hypothetical protein QFC24_004264 [Naganishia onofrii]|uniref:Uncharacterized protein n=1 Tax=Naganishia onofrii TaxID=1851511 RepID=A0ACC2XFJ9_9TREE|nr:hypothetical protein QFC24_004264 [Naganishia onofrii]
MEALLQALPDTPQPVNVINKAKGHAVGRAHKVINLESDDDEPRALPSMQKEVIDLIQSPFLPLRQSKKQPPPTTAADNDLFGNVRSLPKPSSIRASNSRLTYDPHLIQVGKSVAQPRSKPSTSTISSSKGDPYAAFRPPGPAVIGATSKSDYQSYIKPATGGFPSPSRPGTLSSTNQGAFAYKPTPLGRQDWPANIANRLQPKSAFGPVGLTPAPPRTNTDEETENFGAALDNVQYQAEDYDRVSNMEADEHMRELLSGAVGDGEEETEGMEEGEDMVDGFAKGIRLMPHQVRGVKWMRNRERNKRYGGILADDMGLGKTVQALARIVEGIATASEIKAGYKGGTLIVAPLAVMEQWAKEAKTKTAPGRLKVTTHHGAGRTREPAKLEKFDVVITTFQTLASEHGAKTSFAASRSSDKTGQLSTSDSESDGDRFGKTAARRKPPVKKGAKKVGGASALFGVKWLRIIIDEAQNIKNRNTKAAKAAVALQAKYRWCLTGTPIQNNVEELFSLFQFLRARPLDDWQLFRERILAPVKEGRTKLAMKRLHAVLKAIMLRRTKDATIDGKPILNLPARKVEIVQCFFDPAERDFYDAFEKKQELTFNKDKDAIDLRPAPKNDEQEADDLAALLGGIGLEGAKQAKCDMCFSPLFDSKQRHCSDCEPIARKARAQSEDYDSSGLPPSSAKIRMMMKLLHSTDTRSGGKEKTIIFSQFTSFLNLIEPFLRREGVKYVRYDGSMTNDKRQVALEAIKNDPRVKVILISFKAGSTGLNLTCCNNVILLDLWWNPALEDQAFDRAHRLGQKLDVNIFKLTIHESVEDRILTLQNMKRELAAAALSGQGTKNMKLTLNDMIDLFRRNHRHDTPDEDDDGA